ncbi:AOFA-like protein [Mya arenaria]|uniref:Amine oxidase n=1 Tax=Mya arenaria TaxID=6604 RepID=A0ABY7DLY2_MYAAR|nr:AOFA-like protein [Mya arenaria]
MENQSREVEVVIIGAGISGLTAAYRLKKKDPHLDVLVLEAKERVGGRTLTVEMKSADGSDHWDLGGQWVGRCQPQIMALLEELGLEVYPQYIRGLKFLQVGRLSNIASYSSDIPTLPLMGLYDLHRLLSMTDKMALEVNPNDPFSCPKAARWDCETLETFIDSKIWTEAVKDLLRACMRTMFGVELSQISLLYFLTYVASAGNMKNLIEATENTAQEYKIKGGAQQISEKLVKHISKENVLLGEPVSMVTQAGDSVEVISKKGNKYRCKKVILAVPPSQIGRMEFNPTLPVETREIIKRMPPSNAFWRVAGSSGEVVSNGGASMLPSCDMGPLGVVYDATSSNAQPALLGFMGGLQAVQWQKMEYIEYRDLVWDTEPYNEGAPVSCVGPGAMRFYAKGLREPFDKIHFAGTESATIWCGFMNGAVQAGSRAALEVLYDLRPQLVAASDIQVIGGHRSGHKQGQGQSLSGKVVKWSLGLGIALAVIFTARKFYNSMSPA